MNGLIRQVEFLLTVQGWAQLRTGDRRSDSEARALLREAAANLGMKVTTSKQDGFVRANTEGE